MINSYSITNMQTTCTSIHHKINEHILSSNGPSPVDIVSTRSYIQNVKTDTEDQLTAVGLSAENLVIPSRRAYQWILFLCENKNLDNHIHALQDIHNRTKSNNHHLVQLFYQSPIIKFNQGHSISLHQGFINAPGKITAEIGKFIAKPTDKTPLRVIKDYTLEAGFVQVHSRLARIGLGDPSLLAQGDYQDLNPVFEQVNRDYFANRMVRPLISWSSRTTYRKFGHYEFSSDQLSVSKTLDQKSTPPYMLSFLMYHELLHKELGIKDSGTRKTAHTHQFRQMEMEHKDYQAAKEYLEKLARNTRKKRKRK